MLPDLAYIYIYICVCVCVCVCVYIYIYIFIHLFILLIKLININIVPERNEKKILSRLLVILLVAITFSLANFELNYIPFWCIWDICHNLRKLLKQVSLLNDLIDQQKHL